MEKIYEVQRIKQEVYETTENRYIIKSPDDAADHAYELIGEDDREVVLVMVLNTKNHVVAVHRCHVGSLSSSVISTRDIYKTAILNNGASILIVHQHPSGCNLPSKEDLIMAKKIKSAGITLDIPLLDFCIVGEKTNYRVNFLSFSDKGYL